MKINGVSACWSSYSYQEAITLLDQGTIEPMIGQLSVEHVQLCPQHKDILNTPVINNLLKDFPHIQFRLHSDVRIPLKSGYTLDLIDYNTDSHWYFVELAKISKKLNAPLYSLHAGARKDKTLSDLFNNYYLLESIFECPIAIEGHYPFKNEHWLLSNWNEYEQMYLANINYALDLSHLNIVAKREGWKWDLVQKMISSNQCKEIHISFNEGLLDNHVVSHHSYKTLWEQWKEVIALAPKECTIFSEGNQVLELRKQNKFNKDFI